MALELALKEYRRRKEAGHKEWIRRFDEKFSESFIIGTRGKDRDIEYHFIEPSLNKTITIDDQYTEVVYAARIVVEEGKLTLKNLPESGLTEFDKYITRPEVEKLTISPRDRLDAVLDLIRKLEGSEKKAFSSSEFVNSLLDARLVSNRKEAVEILRTLARAGQLYEAKPDFYRKL